MKYLKSVILSFFVAPLLWTNTLADTTLTQVINKHTNLSLGIYYDNVSTNTVISNLPNKQFVGASTTKILTAITVIKFIESGRASYSSPAYKNGPSLQYELEQMVNSSNNDSWDVLNTFVGWSAIIAQAKSIGMVNYNCNGNLVSAKDDAIMLQQLYSGKLLNAPNTAKLLEFMQNTNDESLIPPMLPKGSVVYHKYGWLNNENNHNVLNDTAIIIYNKQTIVLTIYTDSLNSSRYTEQVNAIHEIVKSLIK